MQQTSLHHHSYWPAH